MNLIQRVTNITLNPKTEWPVIAAESSSAADLFKAYIAPLSAIPLLASFIGMSVLGTSIPFLGNVRTPIGAGLISLILGFALGLVAVYLISVIINALAPNFGGEKNPLQALKVTAYALTPAWIAGVLNLIPSLAILGVLAGLYSIYVLYLGLPVLMKAAPEKATAYTAVSVLCSIVVMVVMMTVVGSVVGVGAFTAGGMHSRSSSDERAAVFSEMAKMGEKMGEAGKQMEAAQKSGDAQAQISAATAAIGAAMGSDTQAEVVEMAKLKALLPESIAGMKRNRFEGEKSAMAGFKISKAEAEYRDENNRNIVLTVTDTGGSKMFAAMFAWGMIESDKETDNGYEKMGKVDGRPSHERFQKDGSSGEYGVLVGGRFMVEAHGQNVSMASMKEAVKAVGFGNLEAMRNEGVKQ